jgi:tetratricopeptide (TPR) repeat protein
MSAAATLTLSLMGATYWLTRPPPPKPAPPPTSVLVTDFVDRTNTPVFKGTLESALVQGMEGAAFITAYPRSTAHQIVDEQIKQGAPLDVPAARLVAAREGIKIVLSGTVERDGGGYSVKVDAIDPAVDKVLSSAIANAPSQDRVLAAVGTAAAKLRGALGDTAPESARMAATETVTASSLEALQAYVRAQELQAGHKNQEALDAYRQAISLDPNFGRAYAGMANVYANLKDQPNAKAAYDKALKLVDRMSDREKYRTLGTYYLNIAGNYEKAIENYETLVGLFPADDAAHANLSVAYLNVGNLQGAIKEVREVLKLNPRSAVDRYNYAMYSLYAYELDTAATEGIRVMKEAPDYEIAALPVALSRLLRIDYEGTLQAYAEMAKKSAFGASLAHIGQADLEMFRGRYPAAVKLLQQYVAADEKAGNTTLLGAQYAAAAQAYMAIGQKPRAIAAAQKAARLSSVESVLVLAALTLIDGGRVDEAEKIAVQLENALQKTTIAYARLIRATISMRAGRYAEAIDHFRESIKQRDTWLARFLLGRLYAESEHYPEAMAELELCMKRRGEAADMFFYDTPTSRYLPPAYYWLGRVQQALGASDAKKNLEMFVSIRQQSDPRDPLVEDARKRLK